jgi:uncharacterized protein (DUF305 family)
MLRNLILTLALCAAIPSVALAQGMNMGGNPADKANMEAMQKMQSDMPKPSGEPDKDFAAMMIPHHQGAIDMALVQLKYGRNEKLRRLAQSIIVEQGQEIAYMRSLLDPPAEGHAASPQSHR